MSKAKFKNFQNPLNNRTQTVESTEEKSALPVEEVTKYIYKYGRTTNISSGLIKQIDFDDKTFINRLYDNVDELYTEDMTDLKESIKEIGLLNTVYILEKEGRRFTIVSGLRRLLSIKALVEEGEPIRELNKVVVFEKDTPYEFLNKMSIDENTKRKDLTVLELSYKLRKEAGEKHKSIEDLLDEHNLNRRKFFRITKVMDYPTPLRDIVDEIGVNKAETINKIFKYKKDNESVEDIVNYCKDLTERDLTAYYKERAKKEKKVVELKVNSKQTEVTIKIKKKVDSRVLALIEEFQRKVEELQ